MKLINMEAGELFDMDDGDVSTIDFKDFDRKHYGNDGYDGYDGKVVMAIIKNYRGESFEVPCLYSQYLREESRIKTGDPCDKRA